jgi:uncharacterized protein (DUF433 family)
MITLKQAMYHLNTGITPEELVNEYDLSEEDAAELLNQARNLFEQVVYMAETKSRAMVWGL